MNEHFPIHFYFIWIYFPYIHFLLYNILTYNTGPCFSYAFSRNSAGLFSSAMTCSRNGTGGMSGGFFALAGSWTGWPKAWWSRETRLRVKGRHRWSPGTASAPQRRWRQDHLCSSEPTEREKLADGHLVEALVLRSPTTGPTSHSPQALFFSSIVSATNQTFFLYL